MSQLPNDEIVKLLSFMVSLSDDDWCLPLAIRDLTTERNQCAVITLCELGDPRLTPVREYFAKCKNINGYGPREDQMNALTETLAKFPNITRVAVASKNGQSTFMEFNERQIPARAAVFVASHITYDDQLKYLRECISSLLNQTTEVDIYVSISYESKYESKVRALPGMYQMLPIKILIRDTQTSQMNHIRLLTHEFADNHKLIMFCDDDDTYEPHRVEWFNLQDEIITKVQKSLRERNVLFESAEKKRIMGDTITEFWHCAVLPKQLHDFFSKFQSDAQKRYLNGPYADMLLRIFLDYRVGYGKVQIWSDGSCGRLYNYHEHSESVCATALERHIKTADDWLMLHCACLNVDTYDGWLSLPHEHVKRVMEFIWVKLVGNPKQFERDVRAHAKKMSFDEYKCELNNVCDANTQGPKPKMFQHGTDIDTMKLMKVLKNMQPSQVPYCSREQYQKVFSEISNKLAVAN
jgi:glycosyltransferase involved in cell wall biosynthesis